MRGVVVHRPEDAEGFVDGHRGGGDTRRARIMSERARAFHPLLAGAVCGAAWADVLIGLNPPLLGYKPAVRMLVYVALLEPRRPSRSRS